MPALDYVSIVRSVYGDRRALLFGAFASAFAAALSAYRAQSLALLGVAIAFVVVGALRYLNMRAFWLADIDGDDANAAEHWEMRALIGGGSVALVYGLWCLVAMLLVNDPYAELVATSLSIAAMVGVCARNFGLDRLVTIQTLLLSVPLSLGLFLTDDFYHPVLAGLLVVMLISFRKLAADIRSILLSAVHGRVDASRLAAELDMAISTLQHGLCMLDAQGIVSVANERATRLLALFGIESLVGRPFIELAERLRADGRLPRTAIERLLDTVAARKSGKVLLVLPRARHFEVTISSRHDRTVLLIEDITERVAAAERIQFMARHDGLTGLPNRSYFSAMVSEDIADQRLGAAHGTRSPLISLTIVDIDDFKHVNDTLGHVVGDRLLVEAGKRLGQAMGPGSILARLGGDEFIIYRANLVDGATADADAAAIQKAFVAPFVLGEIVHSSTVSVGVVTTIPIDDDLDTLMAKADLALYSAKGDGKAKSQTFHAQMEVDYQYRQRLKHDLRDAVAAGALTLAFQPQLDILSRRVISCEALARWDHPTLGPIGPSEFIPLAEESGLITEISRWVLSAATIEAGNWPEDIGVAINISARDFRGGDVGAMVTAALAASGLAPHRLEVEVTETALIDEHEVAWAVLTKLAAQGIGIALDDFGTGYSSLSYLQALPFTKLKIDRSFVADVATDQRAIKLLSNVARLGRDLDLTVVAEGIETEDQLAAIARHSSVDLVQGFLFGRPLSAHEIGLLITAVNLPTAAPTIRKQG